jgi:membrane-associated phospholipid phosphatase
MTRHTQQRDLRDFLVTRRVALRGLGFAGIAATLAAPAIAGAARGGAGAVQSGVAFQGASPVAEAAGAVRMWYLSSVDAERPAAPGAATQAEIDEVVQVQAEITPETAESVRLWGSGVAVVPWSNATAALFPEFGYGIGLPQSKVMATLHTAMHDAALAALDAQLAHARPGPAATDSRVVPAAGVKPDQPSFPSEHAAVAGAAAVVLAYLFPDAEPGRFDELATAAAESRIAAGAAFRSDVEAGLTLGRSVGDLAVAQSEVANDVGEFDPATIPTGPGHWQPTPPALIEIPLFPLAGMRTPWVLESGDQFRSAPPPEHGTAAWQAELATVQHVAANRSFEQDRGAVWWGTNSPVLMFDKWTQELIARTGTSLPRAVRILSDLHAALDDSLIATWDGKFTYWASRPITEDPALVTALPTPPYPSYPAGYPAIMGAGTVVIGHYFPEASVDMEARAWEASCSRLWAGIHYAIDNDAGLLLGRQVARQVTALDRASGNTGSG